MDKKMVEKALVFQGVHVRYRLLFVSTLETQETVCTPNGPFVVKNSAERIKVKTYEQIHNIHNTTLSSERTLVNERDSRQADSIQMRYFTIVNVKK